MLFSLEIAAVCTRNGLDKATEYTLVARGARTTFCNLFVVSWALILSTFTLFIVEYFAFVVRKCRRYGVYRLFVILHLIFRKRGVWGRLLFIESWQVSKLRLASSRNVSEGMEAHLGDAAWVFELIGVGRPLTIAFTFFNDHLYLIIIVDERVIIVIMGAVFHALASSLAALSQHHFIGWAEIDELLCCIGCHDFILILIAAAELCAYRPSG